jgi:hypothetical protein
MAVLFGLPEVISHLMTKPGFGAYSESHLKA